MVNDLVNFQMTKENPILDGLIKRKEQLEARIQNLKAKEATQQRKDDTRRKILVGSYVIDKHLKAGNFDRLVSELDKFLFKTNDRALFGLASREEEKSATSKLENIME